MSITMWPIRTSEVWLAKFMYGTTKYNIYEVVLSFSHCKAIGSFRPITKSAHVNFGPCQYRSIAILAHKFCQPGFLQKRLYILIIFRIGK